MTKPKRKKRVRSEWFETWLKFVGKVRVEKKGVIAPTFSAKRAEELREGRKKNEK